MARPRKDAAPEEEINTDPFSATFTGDPRGGHNPKTADFHGKQFPLGEPVTVDDPAWIKAHGHRLRRHNHFTVE